MLSREEAENLALAYLHETEEYGNQFVVSDAEERSWGWLVHTVTTEYARTGDFRHSIPGHGPTAVKHSGEIRPLPPHPGLREAIERELEEG